MLYKAPDDNDDLPSLSALAAKINQAKSPVDDVARNDDAVYAGYAMRLVIDVFAGLIAGGIVGYGVDYFFNTTPFGIIVGVMLGFAGGIRNMIKNAAKMDKDVSGSEEDNQELRG